MLNNRNMQISILEINRKSKFTLLNRLLYLCDSRHLKSRYGHVTIKVFEIEYRSENISIFIELQIHESKSSMTSQWLNGALGQ